MSVHVCIVIRSRGKQQQQQQQRHPSRRVGYHPALSNAVFTHILTRTTVPTPTTSNGMILTAMVSSCEVRFVDFEGSEGPRRNRLWTWNIDFWNQKSDRGEPSSRSSRPEAEDSERLRFPAQQPEKVRARLCGINCRSRVTVSPARAVKSLIAHRLLPTSICCAAHCTTIRYHEPECEFVRAIRKLFFSLRRKRTTHTHTHTQQ